MARNWVRTYENGLDYIESVDGIMWGDGKLPPRWHRCSAQTRGWMGGGYVERCNCGATFILGGWTGRNATRIARRKKQQEDRLPRVQVTCRTCGKPYEAAAGTSIALAEQCTPCWGEAFVGEARHG